MCNQYYLINPKSNISFLIIGRVKVDIELCDTYNSLSLQIIGMIEELDALGGLGTGIVLYVDHDRRYTFHRNSFLITI